MLKHFVTFYYPGILFAETEVKEVGTRDPEAIKPPKGTYAFQFHDQIVVKHGDEVLQGKAKNYSPTYFYGKAYTAAEIKRLFPKESTLLTNVECNGYKRVVKTIMGNWQPLADKDVVLSR